MDLSLVIPAYNEAARLEPSLREVVAFLRARPGESEVLVIDDGSLDDTGDIARAVAAETPVPIRVLSNGINRGKGFSVRRGLLAARGRWVLLTDADLSAPIAQAPLLLEPLESGRADVTVGSRALDRRLIERPQAKSRDLLGRTFNLAMRGLTGLPIHDTQCGFKAFARACVRPLAEALRVDGFGFDVELLLLAHTAGLRIVELPVRWSHVDGSKVAVWKDGLHMLGEVAWLTWGMRRGVYDRALRACARELALHRYEGATMSDGTPDASREATSKE